MSPTADARQQRFLERARALARRPERREADQLLLEVAVMDIGGRRIGIPSASLCEILKRPPVTPLPDLPPLHLGLCQVRGDLVSVVSLARIWGVTDAGDSVLALVESDGRRLGLAASRLVGLRPILASEQAGAATPVDLAGRPVSFVTNDLLEVLDVKRVLALAEVTPVGRSAERPDADTAAGPEAGTESNR